MLCVHMCVGDWNALLAFHEFGKTEPAGASAELSQEAVSDQGDELVNAVMGHPVVKEDRVWDIPVMLSPLNQWLS